MLNFESFFVVCRYINNFPKYMSIFLLAIVIFLSLIQWVVFIDVILSWGALIGIHFRPRWIASITTPLYDGIKKVIPTSFGGLDFTPIIIFILIQIATNLVIAIDPSILSFLSK